MKIYRVLYELDYEGEFDVSYFLSKEAAEERLEAKNLLAKLENRHPYKLDVVETED